MFAPRRSRTVALIFAVALLAAACGSSDSADETTTSAPSTTTTEAVTTTVGSDDPEPEDTTAPTTSEATPTETTVGSAPPPGPTGDLASGSVTTADGLSSAWTLSATADELCFRADLTHPDPEIEADAGPGVDACLQPAGGIRDMNDALSVDVGTVDGAKTIGYLWGRVSDDILVLNIRHDDDTITEVELLAGPEGQRVFAFVVELATFDPVLSLDALSGSRIEDSEPIRDFLRTGPTYPTVTPPAPTTTVVVYPTVN